MVTGKSGAFKVSTTKVGEISSWKLDIETDMKDITTFDTTGWKENTPTLKSWSGSVEGEWKVATDTTGQKALQDALLGGTTVTAEFNVNGTNKYSGNAFIKKISVGEQVADTVKFSAEIVGTGALTYA